MRVGLVGWISNVPADALDSKIRPNHQWGRQRSLVSRFSVCDRRPGGTSHGKFNLFLRCVAKEPFPGPYNRLLFDPHGHAGSQILPASTTIRPINPTPTANARWSSFAGMTLDQAHALPSSHTTVLKDRTGFYQAV